MLPLRSISRFLPIALLLALGAGCFGGGSAASVEEIELNYWRVYDNEEAFEEIIKAYETLHPNVKINYRRLRSDEYEDELIRAIAEGKGPDIFSVHNTKIGEFESLMLPLPPSVRVAYLETKGTLRKETVLVERVQATLSQKALSERYVDVVLSDVLRSYRPDPEVDPQLRVFGLPLSVDTLVMLYNKDLTNAAGVSTVPTTWDEFQEAVRKLTVYGDDGTISQSGGAIGTTGNVERSSDIVSLLMMQNGVQMTDSRGRVSFHEVPRGTPRGIFPGIDAVRFYTDFANPVKDVYTWNETFPSSFEAFANGQTAFFFGYSYHLPLLKAASPQLNIAVAKVPQIAGGKQVNFANYWVEAVSRTSKYSDYAWDFVQFAASAENVDSFLSEAQKPTALRALMNTQLNDPELGPFVEQLLTSESWYKGNDTEAAEAGLNALAEEILAGVDADEAIQKAANAVAATY